MGKTSRRVRTKQTKEELKKIKIILIEKWNVFAKGEQRFSTNKDIKLKDGVSCVLRGHKLTPPSKP